MRIGTRSCNPTFLERPARTSIQRAFSNGIQNKAGARVKATAWSLSRSRRFRGEGEVPWYQLELPGADRRPSVSSWPGFAQMVARQKNTNRVPSPVASSLELGSLDIIRCVRVREPVV